MNPTYCIERIKTEDGYHFLTRKKKIITTASLLNYLQKLYVPPAYDKVFLTTNKNSYCYAIALDKKNRKQYFYHKEWALISRQNKINSLYQLSQHIQKLKADLKKMLSLPLFSETHGEKVLISLLLHLMLYGNFRIGSEEGVRKYKTFGVSTLTKEHVHFINKTTVIIEFNGKKNVINKTTLHSKRICKLLSDIVRENSNSTLFHLKTPFLQFRVTPGSVNDFLKAYGPTSTKVLRTWSVNIEYLKHLHETNSREKALALTAKQFHHSKTVCKNSYIFSEIYQSNIFSFNPNDIFIKFLSQNKKL